jgi:hypothetical protein
LFFLKICEKTKYVHEYFLTHKINMLIKIFYIM